MISTLGMDGSGGVQGVVLSMGGFGRLGNANSTFVTGADGAICEELQRNVKSMKGGYEPSVAHHDLYGAS